MSSQTTIHYTLFDPLSHWFAAHHTPCPSHLQHKPAAQRIYHLYVNPDARQPVNLDGTCVDDIQQRMGVAHPPPDLFNAAQKQVGPLETTWCVCVCVDPCKSCKCCWEAGGACACEVCIPKV